MKKNEKLKELLAKNERKKSINIKFLKKKYNYTNTSWKI